MDYAASNQAGFASAELRESRPLESIASAAQRVNTATVGIQNFLDRFHGPSLEVANAAPPLPDASHHAASLDRLFSALDRLEKRIESLNELG